MIRILLSPHQDDLEQSLTEADMKIVGHIDDTQSCLAQIAAHHPDIAIVHLAMVDGLSTARTICDQSTTTQVLVMYRHLDQATVENALQAGVRGHIVDTASAEDFVHAIHSIHKGHLYLSAEILEQLSCRQPNTEILLAEDVPKSLENLNSPDEWSSLTKDFLNTSPRVWTRGLFYLLFVFAAVLVPWVTLAQVDETGSARGRLEPNGQTLRLDSSVGGSVISIHVKEGEKVQAGQILMNLDSESVTREFQQTQTKLIGQQNQLSQLELLKHQLILSINTQQQQNQAQQLEKQVQVQQAQQSLDDSRRSSALQSVERLSPIDQARANLDARKIAVNQAHSRYAQDQGEVVRFRKLLDQGVVPSVQLIEKQTLAAESRRLLTEAEATLQQANLSLTETQRRYQTLTHQTRSAIEQTQLRLSEQQEGYQGLVHAGELAIMKNTEELNKLHAQITSIQSEMSLSRSQIKGLQYRLQQHQIKAPISGTIFDLPIQKAGAVLQPGTRVAEISPQGVPMILKAQIATSESGFLKTDLPVKLKFDAYPFQDYGVLKGKISRISPTSKVTETAQGNLNTFDVEIELKQTCIPTKTKCLPLTPGQTAFAEVIVRQRRILDLIIDPFKQLQRGGLPL